MWWKKPEANVSPSPAPASNNTQEALAATRHAVETGADAVLLVDPYYNGPSSLEIRREYISPIAAAFPGVDVIPYVIPGRTGAQLLPEDLGLLSQEFKNVRAVKEATGSLENMRRTRSVCGRDFTILSGDDALTYTVMTDPHILAAGVISVISNVAPAAVSEMVGLLLDGDKTQAGKADAPAGTAFQSGNRQDYRENPLWGGWSAAPETPWRSKPLWRCWECPPAAADNRWAK